MAGDAPFGRPPNVDHSACIGDNSSSFPGATHVSSTGATHRSLLIDDNESMALKCPKILGTLNNFCYIVIRIFLQDVNMIRSGECKGF